MSNIYKVTVYDQMTTDGLFGYLEHGTACEVDGTRYAKRTSGALMPAGSDWHDTPEAAFRAAAPRLTEISNKIAAQAQRWQEGRS
jgi:hypothetical protein